MSYTIVEYEALKKAIASGTQSVTYGDKTVTYRSMDDMMRILRIMEAELFPHRQSRRRKLACIDRGYFPEKKI